MPDRESISRIAKILARAGSDNPGEAAAALQGAYKRMVRDGVTLRDLLSLPIEELYQDSLVKLIDLLLAEQSNLSPVGKREAYSQYMLMIVGKFSGGWNSHENQGNAQSSDQSRSDAAKEYEERRKREEEVRKRGQGGQGNQTSGSQQKDDSSFQSEKSPTRKQWKTRNIKLGKLHLSFSPAGFFSAIQILFGRGSITWHALRQPGSAFRLFAASMLWGMGFSGVVLIVAGLFHALTNTGPLWDITLKNAFSFLAAIGTIGKARAFYLAGWFR